MRHKIIIGSLFTVFILLVFTMLNLKDMTAENVVKAKPKSYVKAEELIQSFTIGKEMIDSILVEDIIGVEGVVKEVNSLNNKQTIFLSDNREGDVSVLCAMQDNQINRIQTLGIGDTINIKGVFKGFLKDVILLNCVITNQNE